MKHWLLIHFWVWCYNINIQHLWKELYSSRLLSWFCLWPWSLLAPSHNASFFWRSVRQNVCPSSCAISCWFSIGGGQPKGTEASLVNSLYLLPRLFPAPSTSLSHLSLSFIYLFIYSFIHLVRTFVKPLLANSILQGSRARAHTGWIVETMAKWRTPAHL